MTFLLMGLYIYADYRVGTLDRNESSFTKFDKHYAFISQKDSELLSNIYEAAGAEAVEGNSYLEWIGKDAPLSYDIFDSMKIAKASGVDGIILYPEPGMDLSDLVAEAVDSGIPVITVMEDESSGRRVSFVGMNNYQMGELYARQILECLKDGENNILVITGNTSGESGPGLMLSQMVRVTEQDKKEGEKISFDTLEVNTDTSFDVEEAIRDVFVSSRKLPDIIVCLDLVTTECVAQALVDHNEVGNVSVIGFYDSASVRDSIEHGIIHSTLGIDAGEVGRVSVQALDEYWNLGRVSDYFNVGVSVINAETLQ